MSTGLYTHVFRSAGTVLTADIYNFDHQAHVNGNVPLLTGAFSDDVTQMQVTTDPYPASVESLAVDFSGELARLRFVIQEMKSAINGSAVAQWYSTATLVATGNIFTARGARVSSAAGTQNIPYKTVTPLIFATTRYDTDSFFAIGNPTRLTAPITGIYEIGADVDYTTAGAGVVGVAIRHQDGTILVYQERDLLTGPSTGSFNPTTNAKLVAGAYVEVVFIQSMNTPSDIVLANTQANYSIEAWISLIGGLSS